MREYHKIETIFKRDEKTKELTDEYRNETVKYLKDNEWEFTEKVDGTNIRVVWDGHKVSFYGRTDKAEIPSDLLDKLNELFGGTVNEEIFEEKFGEKEVMLFGEGYGAKIQNGGLYSKTAEFILFDVLIGDNYQPRSTIEEIASYFNIKVVPIVLTGTLDDGIAYVKSAPKSVIGRCIMEGVVGRPKVEMRDRCGKRVIVKIKLIDF